MRPLRLVLVTRRFWPLVGRAERVLANLAAELAARQTNLTVLTARFQAHWPREIVYRGVPVTRLADSSEGRCGPIRSMRSLARWLRQNRSRYDLVYVSMLKHDAYAALKAVGGQVPVVLRAERAGRFGDCHWQLDARGGRRIKRGCLKADAMIGPTRGIQRELIAAGYPRSRIHYLPNGVSIPPRRDAARRHAARAALAAANPMLQVPAGELLAVYVGRLHEAKGLAELMAAWQQVVAGGRKARLWLVGEGPYRKTLTARICVPNLVGRVLLAGLFDGAEELLAAADLFVSPGPEEGASLALLEAMAAGLPIVATDIRGNRELVTDGEHGVLVPPQNAGALAAAIDRLWEEPDLAARLGAAARKRVEASFSLAAMADAHLSLFDSLIQPKSNQEPR